MKAFREGNNHQLRIDRGENLVSSVTGYCEEVGLPSAVVWGIGAVENVEIGYYDLGAKQYRRCRLDGIFEILSLWGNITTAQGRVFWHAHVTLGSADFSVSGGHLFDAVVAITGEIFILGMSLPLTRTMNEEIGLKLIE